MRMWKWLAGAMILLMLVPVFSAQAEVTTDTTDNCVGLPITWRVEDDSLASPFVYTVTVDGKETTVSEETEDREYTCTPEKAGSYKLTVQDANGVTAESDEITVSALFVFGTYEQDGNTEEKEPLEWRVIAVEGDKALLITDKIIHNDSYFNPWWIKYKYTYWAYSYVGDFEVNYRGSGKESAATRVTGISATSIPLKDGTRGTEEDLYRSELHARYWCNDMFYWYAFTDEERERILLTHNVNNDNPEYGTEGGPDTDDYVFFLSYDEVMQYMPEKADRKTSQTAVARKESKKNESSYWWLRTPGKFRVNAMYVYGSNGGITAYGSDVGHDMVGYRPAMWISIGG